MRNWPVWVAALWWGSLTTVGFGVVPALFHYLPTAALAGSLAARLFEMQTLVSTVLGVALLLSSRSPAMSVPGSHAGGATIWILGGLILALLLQFAVAPNIVQRLNLRLWHTVGTLMYVLQCFCAAATFRIMVARGRRVQV